MRIKRIILNGKPSELLQLKADIPQKPIGPLGTKIYFGFC